MTDQPLRAAVYTRVSTDEQAEHGWSIDEQERLGRKHVADKGWQLVDVFADPGWSGAREDRPDLQRMLGMLDDLDVIVVWAMDRLTRDLLLFAKLAPRLVKAKVRIESLTSHVDLETPEGEAMAGIAAVFGQFERKRIGERVRMNVQARALSGSAIGGRAYGYEWVDRKLVIVAAEAVIVRRTYDDWINGVTQRAIARALDAAGIPPARSGHWTQSMISRVLANPLYKGWFRYRGDVLPGNHEPIVTEAVWDQAQQVRQMSVRRTGGRWPDGGHLLVKGTLRCGRCGSAMIPRKGRPGGGRDRYECSGRVEHGRGFCDQPSIRRELIDEPFLGNVTDYYIDWEASLRLIAERAAQDLVMAREAAAQAEHEVKLSEARLAQIDRGWQDRVLDDDNYRLQHTQVSGELEAARAALERSQAHVEWIEQTGVSGDAEQQFLDKLATLKRDVADDVSRAPNLNAMRNVIGQLFESVELAEWKGTDPDPDAAADLCEALTAVGLPTPKPVLDANGGATYVLLPRLRSTPSPTGQLTPVGSIEQYPPSDTNPFLARYCWW
jgi:site-specific DNA recombinase